MRVAFQGVHGAYSEIAALHLFGARIAALPCETFEEVFRSVTRGLADRGVIPIENSLAGSIHQNYDLLLHHRVHIVAETHRRIDHVLVAPPGVRMEALRAVRSHPQALAQCSRFLRSHRRLKPFVFFMDGTGAVNADWIIKKKNVTKKFGHSSWGIKLEFLERDADFQAETGLDPDLSRAEGGAVPLHVRGKGRVGTLIVSGLAGWEDHALAVAGLEQWLTSAAH